ncbi:MAG: type II toxin-antitoxin system prevent-host-death family antitoxin [Methylomonas sp.]|nr:type II toxin-antitoxin system prevent-host-death family antitoxin [Methylomonas sp.]PPD19398.1 MAG: type II toxin-antitoxin system prevent-host-death family antitoxin [Methylomonas sp.]PPD24337.1 MAG: type II toxin-antitoxin system prevent-host-death family antitoxin [Methylomonas sp.]PPD32889.1 MAG: type II toxin-antitoxin system prevent-host-death family antitoxin [Methylomonas sp.]PPD54047.1 MAG: type II toxin-antitoxin system prevent-host-death family antitoxin [Methylomonas sp.]
MQTVTIQQAKADLSRLVEQAAKGEVVVIAEAGKPLTKMVPVDDPGHAPVRRLGFLAGQIQVPDDFDRMGEDVIDRLFGDDHEPVA